MRTVPTVIVIFLLAAAPALGDSLLDLERDRIERIVALWPTPRGPATEPDPVADLPMTRQLAGIAAVFERGDLAELRSSFPADSSPLLRSPPEDRLCVLFVHGRRESKRIEIGWAETGGERPSLLAWEADMPSPRVCELDTEAFRERVAAWPRYDGGFAAPTDPIGEVFTLAKPYEEGPRAIDRSTLSARFYGGASVTLDPADRVLADETFQARLPSGYDPRYRWGLLIWISPGPEGTPPPHLFDATDGLGLICIGADNSGNERLAVNRLQLALDAGALACRRYHVDPDRVYVAGMSGGGRVASLLAICYPDVFCGCVAIVGLSIHKPVPTGTGLYVRPGIARPRPELFALLRERRFAAITGPRDDNHEEIVAAVRLLTQDGLNARVDDYEDMAHEMPTPERFAMAMRWVDAPGRERAARNKAEAQRLLETYVQRYEATPPRTGAQHRLLERIIAEGPWTDPAWTAIDLLSRATGRPDSSDRP